jgi:D-proline reductase (dithiol) PrdB
MADDGPGTHDFGTAHTRPPPDVTGKAGAGVTAGAAGTGGPPCEEMSWARSAVKVKACMSPIIFRHTATVASLSDLSLKNRLFMATYRYRTLDPVPFARPRKPLREARVALVTTGGVYLPSQTPFDGGIKGGDASFREIPADTDLAALGIAHKSDAFDQTGFRADRNLGFPLERLREMAAHGEIGALNGRALSFMGSITAPGRLVKETAPAAVALLEADGIDVALLVPL